MENSQNKPDWRDDPRIGYSPEEAKKEIDEIKNMPDEMFPIRMENGYGPVSYSREEFIEMIRANTRRA